MIDSGRFIINPCIGALLQITSVGVVGSVAKRAADGKGKLRGRVQMTRGPSGFEPAWALRFEARCT